MPTLKLRAVSIIRRAPNNARQDEKHQAREHADGRQAKAIVPSVGFTDVAARNRGQGRTQVDADVEDREPRVSFGTLGIQLADHGRNVWFEEAVANDQQGERVVERRFIFHPHQQVSGTHQKAADDDRPPFAQELIGQHPTDVWRGVDQGPVGRVDAVGPAVLGLQEAFDHVEREQGPHAVERKAFPHFDHKELEEGPRVSTGAVHRDCIGRIHELLAIVLDRGEYCTIFFPFGPMGIRTSASPSELRICGAQRPDRSLDFQFRAKRNPAAVLQRPPVVRGAPRRSFDTPRDSGHFQHVLLVFKVVVAERAAGLAKDANRHVAFFHQGNGSRDVNHR